MIIPSQHFSIISFVFIIIVCLLITKCLLWIFNMFLPILIVLCLLLLTVFLLWSSFNLLWSTFLNHHLHWLLSLFHHHLPILFLYSLFFNISLILSKSSASTSSLSSFALFPLWCRYEWNMSLAFILVFNCLELMYISFLLIISYFASQYNNSVLCLLFINFIIACHLLSIICLLIFIIRLSSLPRSAFDAIQLFKTLIQLHHNLPILH